MVLPPLKKHLYPMFADLTHALYVWDNYIRLVVTVVVFFFLVGRKGENLCQRIKFILLMRKFDLSVI